MAQCKKKKAFPVGMKGTAGTIDVHDARPSFSGLSRELEREIRGYLSDQGVPLRGSFREPRPQRMHLRVLDELLEDLALEQRMYEEGGGAGGFGEDGYMYGDEEEPYSMGDLLDAYGYSEEEKDHLMGPEGSAMMEEERREWMVGVKVLKTKLEYFLSLQGKGQGQALLAQAPRNNGEGARLYFGCDEVSGRTRVDLSGYWVTAEEWRVRAAEDAAVERAMWEKEQRGPHTRFGDGKFKKDHKKVALGKQRRVEKEEVSKKGPAGSSNSGAETNKRGEEGTSSTDTYIEGVFRTARNWLTAHIDADSHANADSSTGANVGGDGDAQLDEDLPDSLTQRTTHRAEAQLAQDVQDFYDLSVLLMTGEVAATFAVTQGLGPLTPTDVAAAANEIAGSALLLSMWLADDLALSQPPVAEHVKWAFRFSSLVAQPIHVALGFRLGFNTEPVPASASHDSDWRTGSVVLPPDLHNRLRHSLGGKSVSELLSLNRTASLDDEDDKNNFVASTSLKAVCGAVEQGEEGGSSVGSTRDSWLGTLAILETLDMPKLSDVSLNNLKRQLCARGIDPSFLDKSLDTDDTSPQKEETMATAQQEHERENVVIGAMQQLPSNECPVAASLYFPVTQFVAAHFGIIESGVHIPEDIRIQTVGFDEQFGTESTVHVLEEAEAHNGDPDAQVWLARRYWWGMGGLPPNEAMAMRYFQYAADQNHPEGLYNVGVMHAHGAGDLTPNYETALEYFRRAADHENPFPMAQHAMGSHFLHLKSSSSSETRRNFAKALMYFKKAADGGNMDSMYTLAVMLKDGDGADKPDIPAAVRYLAQASSGGHVQSMNYLAHALYDVESWLGQYEQDLPMLEVWETGWERLPELEPVFVELPGFRLPIPLRVDCSTALPLLKRIAEHIFYVNDLSTAALDAYTAGEDEEALLLYDELSELGVEWAQENAAVLHDSMGRDTCAEHRSLASSALDGGLAGRWSAWLTELMVQVQMEEGQVTGFWQSLWLAFKQYVSSFFSDNHDVRRRSRKDHRRGRASRSQGPGDTCATFEGRAVRRWAQLAQRGDTLAMRELARRTELGQLGDAAGWVIGNEKPMPIHVKRRVQHRLVFGEDASARAPHGQGSSGLDSGSGGDMREEKYASGEASGPNTTHSALLYATAASRGDVESLVALGWQLFHGSGSIPANRSAAYAAFQAALHRENSPVQDPSVATPGALAAERKAGDMLLEDMAALDERIDGARVRMDYPAEKSTGGAAPGVALMYMSVVERLEGLGLINAGTASSGGASATSAANEGHGDANSPINSDGTAGGDTGGLLYDWVEIVVCCVALSLTAVYLLKARF